ncbi:rhodanese-like domain-containing protein [Streptomyces sp. NBC_00102]|uniref:rhodanese-like domain-containing protein n=1 Tax=Streptomyces sp. NBC_00102 TaxID=2975652 RepID=UPI00224E1C2F|nr:rhodanese-like domain-containing protein [Streptomyces sp. NBC_00102]MCX5396672.1 rhodanese-like domain-containing protein [Streptomyces sp. NBC_00102]
MANPETRVIHHPDQLIDPEAAEKKRQSGALFIDVRRNRPDAPKGDIEGAVKVGKERADELLDPESPNLIPQLSGLSEDSEIVVFCNSEYGSDPIIEKLNAYGYGNVTHVRGGFARWQAEALPTVDPLPAAEARPAGDR